MLSRRVIIDLARKNNQGRIMMSVATTRYSNGAVSSSSGGINCRGSINGRRAKYFSSTNPAGGSAIKPWTQRIVDSSGDYRDESFLEEYIGGNLYSNQSKMPKLPVPDVQATLDKMLPTALPLARNESEAQALQDAASKFVAQVDASQLQSKLLERKLEFDGTHSSWLQRWWNKLGYLQYRDPICIFVTYFFHLKDDITVPVPPKIVDANSKINVHRAAAMVYSMSEFREKVCSGQMPAETIGKKGREKMICTTAYKYMFNSCRIPRPEEDVVRLYDPSQYKHIVVARKGRYFTVNFLDDQGKVLPLETLEQRLAKVLEMADAMHESEPVPYELGWLTGNHRDDWSKAHAVITNNGTNPTMLGALEKLESAAMMICFDDAQPVSRNECGALFLHAGDKLGYNRWYDKSIQISVTDNGKVGLIGEHAMMDGMPMVNFVDHITKNTYQVVKDKSDAENTTKTNSNLEDGITDIFGNTFKEISADKSYHENVVAVIEKGKADYKEHVNGHTVEAQSFHGYGSDYIKKCGYSPDAFVQVAMQLATYRLWGEQAGTYEATQVRTFLHGRTETTRTVSPASAKFVQSLGLVPKYDELGDQTKVAEKMNLLKEAVQSHVAYMKDAAQAQGVDRHLFGLSMIASENNVTPPDLFSDPVFNRSKTWRVSTSHLTHPNIVNWGYGEVVPDGVGLSYSIHPQHCQFNVTALQETNWSSQLCHLLEEAMLEIRTLIEVANKDKPLQSKL